MFILKQTCGACPEQYSVFLNDEYVGSMRLRHGGFTVEDANGDIVYSASPKGYGIFEWDERDYYLNAGCLALKQKLNPPEEPLYSIELDL